MKALKIHFTWTVFVFLQFLFSASVNAAPIHDAVEQGDINAVKQLLSQGAGVNLKDPDGNTPLILASWHGDTKMVQFLINTKDIDLDMPNHHGTTALMLASVNGQTQIVKLLMDYGADVNAQNKNNGHVTALMMASHYFPEEGYFGHTEVVKLLVKKANLDLQNDSGHTALMYASIGAVDVVRVLINKGANLNLKDINGNTALKIASNYSQVQIVQMLKEAGAIWFN